MVQRSSEMSVQPQITEQDRLDWVKRFSPVFGDGFLRVVLGPAAAPDGKAGSFLAAGTTQSSCIDNALTGFLVRLS